jgi:hypothetical protein
MSAFSTGFECIEYRIVLIRPGFQEVLTIAGEGGYRLLRVSLPRHVRPVPSLRKALANTWGIQGWILDFFAHHRTPSPCALVELFSEDTESPFCPVPIDQITEDDMSESERSAVIALLDGGPCGPFSRPGWIDSAIAWVENATHQRVSSKLNIEQHNAWGAFTLIRFPMKAGPSFWLKATGRPNAHELAVTTLISSLSPGHVPSVIATNPTWNAWIMPDEGVALSAYPLDSRCRFDLLEKAVMAMAELQLKTAGLETELLAIGAFDQRLATLRDNSALLFERIAEAMSLQTSTRVPRIGEKDLDELQDTFVAACSVMEELAIPATVVHGDVNAGNILYRDGCCVFIDWCETYVGCPFITLQHLLLLNQPANPTFKNTSDQILINCYRNVMKKICDQSSMDRAIACMPLLAAASAMYGRGDWLQSSVCDSRQAYIRMLARRMDRAAQNFAFLESAADRTFTK